jgi:cobyric acid synthase
LIKNDDSKTIQSLRLLQNPVQSSLNFSYQSSSNDIGVISIYTISGTRLSTIKSIIHQGANSFSIELNNKLTNGMYILEITSGYQRSTTKFLKQ